jgi:hypothetical protein
VPTDPHDTVRAAAQALVKALAERPAVSPVRVAEAAGGVACLIQVWAAGTGMPTAAGERRATPPARRDGCRKDILEAITKAGRPLTRKQLVRILREAKKGHGPGTVAKALADLTTAGALVNPKDKRGYRLAEWPRRSQTPGLFD